MDVVARHLQFRAEGKSDGRTLRGIALPFGQITRIDNWMEGRFDEQFKRGAFRRSLGQRTPKLQFDHGTHPLFGSLPIGEFESLTERQTGLDVVARIFDAPLFEPLREALATDQIDGMSIRFRPLKVTITQPEQRDDGGDVELRTVTEAELIELGPVMFPAYAGTSVDLRSLGDLDLTNQIDRHRLAMALLGGDALADRVGQPPGPGTAPVEAGAPASTAAGQADGHPDGSPRRHRLLARRAVLAGYDER